MEAMKSVKAKVEQAKWRAKGKLRKTANWVKDNKELVVAVAPICVAAVSTGFKVANRHVKIRQQTNLKELYCYDNRLGHYWRLKRPLSNLEWLEIDKRKRHGEHLADILAELRVLK